jgi:CHAT domain-containing protein
VVLSACRTGRADARRGFGATGIAAEFLRAGVEHVVATQWDVRDDAASSLMRAFYDALASGEPVWDAVRAAQLAVSRTRPPRDWAGYVAYATAMAGSGETNRTGVSGSTTGSEQP